MATRDIRAAIAPLAVRNDLRRSIFRLLRGLAVLSFILFDADARALTTLTLDRVYWTDRAGNTHRLQGTNLSFYEQDSVFDDFLITGPTGTGNVNGGYAQLITGVDDGLFDNTLELYTWINAEVPGVGKVGSNWGAGNVYATRRPTGTGTWDVTIDTNLTTTATADNTTDGGTAVGFLQAIKFAHDFLGTLGTVPNNLDVRYSSAFNSGSSALGTQMTVSYDNWGSWDTIFHEYGHVFADANALDNSNIGAGHAYGCDNIGSNCTDQMMNPIGNQGNANGTLLAWQEGIATYIGLMAVKQGNLDAWVKAGNPGDPGLPSEDTDEWYDNYQTTNTTVTNANRTIHVNIENRTGGGIGVGEGDELSVMRIVWDLYDTDDTNTEIYSYPQFRDRWGLGAQTVHNLMVNDGDANDGRLIDFWGEVQAAHATNPQRASELGEVFEEYGVSARAGVNTGGAVVDDAHTQDKTPLLAWTEQNSGYSSRFKVLIFDAGWTQLVLASPELIDQTMWEVTAPLAYGDYNWVVVSNSVMQGAVDFAYNAGANTVLSGSYWSGAVQFTIVPEPASFALMAGGLLLAAARRRKRPR